MLGLLLVGYLLYGKYQEVSVKANGATPAALANNICDTYRENLKALIRASATAEFRGGDKPSPDIFSCTAIDESVGRIGTLSVTRSANAAGATAVLERAFRPPANFRIAIEPMLGAKAFCVVGSHVTGADDDYFAYFGHNENYVVSASLARSKPSAAAFTNGDSQMAKELALSILKTLK